MYNNLPEPCLHAAVDQTIQLFRNGMATAQPDVACTIPALRTLKIPPDRSLIKHSGFNFGKIWELL